MTSSVIPSPYTIVHIERIDSDPAATDPDTGNPLVDPDTGNPLRTDGPPVVRKVQAFEYPSKRSGSSEEMGTEFVDRVATNYRMAVANPQVYHPSDQVILNPELDADDAWVPGSGQAYVVEGIPSDDRMGPFPGLFAQFGGVVKIRRVT